MKKKGVMERFQRKYFLHEKGLEVVVEELNQRIIAKANKVKRYQGRVTQYKQNRLFANNRHQLDGDVQEEQEAVHPPTHQCKIAFFTFCGA